MDDHVPVAAPLAGLRVVTTRGASRDDRLGVLLAAAGARVLAWPTCAYPPPRDAAPLEAALARLDRFDWVVFTSPRAASAAAEGPLGSSSRRPRVAVVGPATARAATDAGWTVAVEGRGPGARGLAAQVAATSPLAGARVLFPAASGAAATVEDEFTALGARVTRVEAYRTEVTPPPAERVLADMAAGVDAVTFASPSAVEAVDRALGGVVPEAATDAGTTGDPATGGAATGGVTRALRGEMASLLGGVAVVCIGPTTGAALVRRGVVDVRVAATATLEGMVEALVESFGSSGLARPDADLGCAAGMRAAATARHSGVGP